MVFEKPSLRTRATFAVGMTQLGGSAVYLGPAEVGLGTRETPADCARNLDRWFDLITVRTFGHKIIEEMAEYSAVPVINALTDAYHPCQVLADCQTLIEHKGVLEGLKIAFVGDGNNMVHSWLEAAAIVPFLIQLALVPRATNPIRRSSQKARSQGAKIIVTDSVEDAVADADAIYTDVWTSMGQENEVQDRLRAFRAYQVNNRVVSLAKSDAVVMHCLPAHRGEEITDEVLESSQCVAFDQAENRLHAQKAVMVWLLNGFKGSIKKDRKQRSEEIQMNVKKVVLAYSGGLDTSVILRWLKEEYGCEVIAFCADLGQGEDLQAVRKKAIKTGASKVVIGDLREEFVKNYVFPMLRANAVYEGSYLFGTSIARPLIAKGQIDVAVREKADAVSHGATGKGNDQVRFELTYYALKPGIKVIAPWREWNLNARSTLIDYARKHGIPVPVTKAKPYSTDRNLFHISYEGGILEDPWKEPPADMFVWCRPVEKAPNRAEYIEIDYLRGDPVALNGQKLLAGKFAGALERYRRQAWHRPGRCGREPLCRHEVARRL